jgi:putative transposase
MRAFEITGASHGRPDMALSVSASNQKEVTKYIRDQERHHRRMTFQEEFLAWLRKHGIAFDECFLWK